MTNIMIVDDHPIVRHGLQAIIEQQQDFSVVAGCHSAAEAMESLKSHPVDVALVDISLGDTSGLSLIQDMLDFHADLPILVVSMHEESLFAPRAKDAGARGYLMKHEASNKVVDALRCILAGDSWFKAEDEEKKSGGIFSLSDREIQVFELLGRGRTIKDIATVLSLSVKTIESHRDNIRQKLCLKSSNDLLHQAISWIQQSGHRTT